MGALNKLILGLILLVMTSGPTDALELVSPAQYTEVHPGDTVVIVVKPSPGELIGRVFFDLGGTADAPPYEYHYTVDLDKLGDIKVIIMAMKADSLGPFATNNDAFSSRVDLHLKSTLPSTVKIQSYSVDPPAHFALHITAPDAQGNIDADQEKISVYALYSDGIKREISRAVDGTTYSSNKEAVVKVSADGLATAIGPGTANITIRNGSYKAVIDVLVVKTN